MFPSDSGRAKRHSLVLLLSCLVLYPALSGASSPESRSADLFLLSGAPGFHFWDESGLGWGPAFRDVRGLGAQRTAVTIDGVETSFADPRHGFRSPLPGPWSPRYVPTVNRGLFDHAATSTNAAATIELHSRTDIPPEANVDQSWLAASAGSWGQASLFGGRDSDLGRDWTLRTEAGLGRTDGFRAETQAERGTYALAFARPSARGLLHLGVWGYFGRWQPMGYGLTRNELDDDRYANPQAHPQLDEDRVHQPIFEARHDYDSDQGHTMTNRAYFSQRSSTSHEFRANRRASMFNLTGDNTAQDYRTDLVTRFNRSHRQAGLIHESRFNKGRHVFEIGGEYRRQINSDYGDAPWVASQPADAYQPENFFDYRSEENLIIANLSDRMSLGSQVELTGGIQYRSQELSLTDDERFGVFLAQQWQVVAPRLGVTWTPRPETTIFVHGAQDQRNPTLHEIYSAENYLHSPAFRPWNFGFEGRAFEGPEVQPEKLTEVALGGDFQWAQARVKVTAYWLEISDRIVFEHGTIDAQSVLASPHFDVPNSGNTGRSLHRGVELEFNLPLAANWHCQGGGHWADNRLLDQTTHYASSDPSHIQVYEASDAVLPESPPFAYRLQLEYRRAGAAGWARVRGQGRVYFDGQNRHERSTDPYALLDLGIVVKLRQCAGTSGLRLTAMVANLLDQDYEAGGYTGTPWAERNRGAYWFVGAPRNFRMALEQGF